MSNIANAVGLPRLNAPARTFTAKTTQGDRSLTDCKGRSIPEIVRLVTAMQTSDANGAATPAGWEPSDDDIVSPPKTIEVAVSHESEGFNYTDWYYSTRSLAA